MYHILCRLYLPYIKKIHQTKTQGGAPSHTRNPLHPEKHLECNTTGKCNIIYLYGSMLHVMSMGYIYREVPFQHDMTPKNLAHPKLPNPHVIY
jgi:hypothetical protein